MAKSWNNLAPGEKCTSCLQNVKLATTAPAPSQLQLPWAHISILETARTKTLQRDSQEGCPHPLGSLYLAGDPAPSIPHGQHKGGSSKGSGSRGPAKKSDSFLSTCFPSSNDLPEPSSTRSLELSRHTTGAKTGRSNPAPFAWLPLRHLAWTPHRNCHANAFILDL